MDITERKITKIAREVSKFTVRTLRAEGVGPGEFDVLHAIRKNPGITQSGVCRITGFDKGAVARQTASLEAKGYLRREANPCRRPQPLPLCHRAGRAAEKLQGRRRDAVLRPAARPAHGVGAHRVRASARRALSAL